jgi:hypothetical protein
MFGRPPRSEGTLPLLSSRDRSRSGYRRAFWISLGISAVLHVVAVVLYPSLLIKAPVFSPPFGDFAPLTRPAGTELVNLEELPGDRDLEVLPPEEIRESEVPAVAMDAPNVGGEEDPVADVVRSLAPGPTAAERLRPREGDLRLWAPVDPEITRLTEEEIMRLLLVAELEDLADSMAIAEEIARRGTDWTYTDDEGRKWGVSPGKLHLGDITLPLPFGFSTSPWEREQNAGRIWAWDDINQAAARKGVQDVWKERAEAIRRRMEAERKPDTTGVRR